MRVATIALALALSLAATTSRAGSHETRDLDGSAEVEPVPASTPLHPMLLNPCYARRAELLASGATWAGVGAEMVIGGILGGLLSAVVAAQTDDTGVRDSMVVSVGASLLILTAGGIIAHKSRDNLRLYSVTQCTAVQ